MWTVNWHGIPAWPIVNLCVKYKDLGSRREPNRKTRGVRGGGEGDIVPVQIFTVLKGGVDTPFIGNSTKIPLLEIINRDGIFKIT